MDFKSYEQDKKMKKLTAVFVLLMAFSAALSATPVLQVGGTVFYDNVPTNDSYKDISSYGFGAEGRVNLFDWVSFTLPVTIGFTEDTMSLGTNPSLNLNIPAAQFLDIAFGVGTRINFMCDSDGWSVGGRDLEKFSDIFLGTGLFYRAAVTFNVGFLGIGLAANVPCEGTFDDLDFSPDWEATGISASVLFNFF